MARITPLIAIAVLSLTMTPSHAGQTTREYIAAGLSDVVTVCQDENPAQLNIGKACASVGPNKGITITVVDQVSPAVSFYWVFYDSNGDCAVTGPPTLPGDDPSCESDGFACQTLSTTTPAGTARVEVLLDGPVFTAAGPCLDVGGAPAVVGTVTFDR